MNTPLDRRRFLRLVALGGAGAALGGPLGCSAGDAPGDASPAGTPDGPAPAGATPGAGGPGTTSAGNAAAPVPTADTSRRILVAIELDGGNDGLDTVVPYGDGRYVDARPTVGLDPGSVLAVDDRYGWHPALARVADRGLAALVGVGTPDPDLSHFESMRRWWEGDPTGTGRAAIGFLGRLCDVLDDGAPVTGVSVALGATPALRSNGAVTLSVPEQNDRWWLDADDSWSVAFRKGLRGLATATGDGTSMDLARTNLATAFEFLDAMGELGDRSEAYPWTDLGSRLELTARLLGADTGVRVVHVPISGFDTHSDHRATHDRLMGEIDAALDTFLADLGERGMADRVLVATYSEFGRRVAENDGGTDHGAASVAMLAGPVVPGLHGEYPSLADLDDEDNLRATVGLDTYYATLAEAWFGVPAAEVLDGSPRPLDGLIA